MPHDMAHDEHVELYGRWFTFRFVPRPDLNRIEVHVLQGRGPEARAYVPAPVRGRDEEDARDRAHDVLRNYAGLDRYLELIRQVLGAAAPGARLEVEENAADVRVTITGGARRLTTPLALVREDALDPDRTDEELLAFIRAHVDAYLEDSR